MALDAVTGRVLWRDDSGAPMSASPAVVGDEVFVATDAGKIVALGSTDGSERWTVNVVGQPRTAVVTGGLVLVATNGGELIAFGDPDA